jgi:hypothetical protein
MSRGMWQVGASCTWAEGTRAGRWAHSEWWRLAALRLSVARQEAATAERYSNFFSNQT